MILKTQLYVGKKNPRDEVLEPLRRHINCKANGGLYTSTFLGEELGSHWLQWCMGNDFHLPNDDIWNGYFIEIKKDAKIYVVDSVEDMNFLFDNYSTMFHEGINMEEIDFVKLSQDFDGLHMTMQGERVTRHPFLFGFEGNIHRNMYGWDVESTHFFRDVFDSIEPITFKLNKGEDDEL